MADDIDRRPVELDEDTFRASISMAASAFVAGISSGYLAQRIGTAAYGVLLVVASAFAVYCLVKWRRSAR